jgi:hypothetical protein
MTDAFTIGWTQAQTATRRTTYRRLLGLDLIVTTVLGLVAIVLPACVSNFADLPVPPSHGLIRLGGTMLLILAALYLPGFIEPVVVRAPNVIGILARFALTLAAFYVGRGFVWFALYELLFGVLLAWSYRGLLRAELMSHP